MDINQINDTIKELESGQTTFDACHKLATLYTIRDRLTKSEQISDVKVLTDIFPCYESYIENKRKYQLKQTSADSLYSCMSLLCLEISDFIHNIYSSCDTEVEKAVLKNVIASLNDFLL